MSCPHCETQVLVPTEPTTAHESPGAFDFDTDDETPSYGERRKKSNLGAVIGIIAGVCVAGVLIVFATFAYVSDFFKPGAQPFDPEQATIIAHLKENAGEPDKVSIVRWIDEKPANEMIVFMGNITDPKEVPAFWKRWSKGGKAVRVKFRVPTGFGGVVVQEKWIFVLNGEVQGGGDPDEVRHVSYDFGAYGTFETPRDPQRELLNEIAAGKLSREKKKPRPQRTVKPNEPQPRENRVDPQLRLLEELSKGAIPNTREQPQEAPPAAASPKEAQTQPKEPPSADHLAEAQQLVAESYKEDIETATAPSEKAALAQKLFHAALGTTDDEAAQFVLFEKASGLAAESGQFALAAAIISSQAKEFQVDEIAKLEAALTVAATSAKSTYDYKAVAESWLILLNRAVEQDRYEDAMRFSQLAERAAEKSPDDVFAKMVSGGAGEVQQIAAMFDDVKVAKARIKTDPNDKKAAEAWGEFLCIYKGNWKEGLPLWAKGSGGLAELASQDLEAPIDLARQVAVADGWWEAAESNTKPLPKRHLRKRAADLYQRALPGLSGLTRKRAEKRLEQFRSLTSAFKEDEWIEILGTVDVREHGLKGKWLQKAGKIAAQERGSLLVPVVVGGSYRVLLEFELSQSASYFLFILPIGDHDALIRVDRSKGLITLANSQSDHRGSVTLRANRKYKLSAEIDVIADQVTMTVELDNKRVFRWEGVRSQLLPVRSKWELPEGTLGLATYGQTAFDSLKFKLKSGSAGIFSQSAP